VAPKDTHPIHGQRLLVRFERAGQRTPLYGNPKIDQISATNWPVKKSRVLRADIDFPLTVFAGKIAMRSELAEQLEEFESLKKTDKHAAFHSQIDTNKADAESLASR